MSRSRWNREGHSIGRDHDAPGTEEPAPGAAILGLGTDLCTVARLRREVDRDESDLLAAAFHADERARCFRHPDPARLLAACFAAKESVIKALAPTGGQGAFWQDIFIDVDGRGHPTATLHGRIADLADQLGVAAIHLTHAHGRDYATACAVVSGHPARQHP